MKRKGFSFWFALCLLGGIAAAFYLRAADGGGRGDLPVSRVLVTVTAVPSGSAEYKYKRAAQREQELAALSALAEREPEAAEALRRLIGRMECEQAAEEALSASGWQDAVCAWGEQGLLVCLPGHVEPAEAQKIIELCACLAGIDAEFVFILDGCGYL